MTDEALIRALQLDMPHIAQRGFPQFSANTAELIKRFRTLTEAHRMLSEREERLTAELVKVRQ